MDNKRTKNKPDFQARSKQAFTLSDVLLTLVTIAIVALLVISPLLKNVQDAENKTAAKKALSVANQSYKISQIDNGGGFGAYDGGTSTKAVDKFNALKSQLKVINDCAFGASAQGKCWANSGVGLKDYYVTGCWRTSNDGSAFTNASFTTADGMFWMLYSQSITTADELLFIDVNGNKKPNDWGKDVFIFKMNDTNITPLSGGCGNLKHNDGTAVSTTTEFLAPFK